MSYAADDYEAIRRRQEEITAERNLALTGSTVPATEQKVGEYAVGWPADCAVGYLSPGLLQSGFAPSQPVGWPYTAASDYDPA